MPDSFFDKNKPSCPSCRRGRITINTGNIDQISEEMIYNCDFCYRGYTKKSYIESAFKESGPKIRKNLLLPAILAVLILFGVSIIFIFGPNDEVEFLFSVSANGSEITIENEGVKSIPANTLEFSLDGSVINIENPEIVGGQAIKLQAPQLQTIGESSVLRVQAGNTVRQVSVSASPSPTSRTISTTVNVTQQQPAAQSTIQSDFSIAYNPSSREVKQGEITSYNITIASVNNFTGTVNLTLSGCPANANCSLNRIVELIPERSLIYKLEVNTSNTTATASYLLTVTGTSGSLSHFVNPSLSIAQSVVSSIQISICPSPTFPANACSVSTTNVTLSWNAVNGASSYNITKCDANGQNCDGGFVTTGNSRIYTGLLPNTTYSFKVKVNSSDATCTSPSIESPINCKTMPLPQENISVLVLKYFPLDTSGTKLNSTETGLSDDLSSIKTKVDSLTQQGVDKLTLGSAYHGYKISSEPYLKYSVMDTKEFLTAIPRSTNVIPWNPSAFRPDYMKILNSVNICDYVDNKNVTQVWIWGYHYGLIEPAESNMAMGLLSQSLWNHGTYGDVSNSEQINDMPTCSKTYTLYNYNYERGLAELLEDHGHQIESVMSFVEPLMWDSFKSPHGQSSPTVNHCGWTHSPPNVKDGYYGPGGEYDWNNETDVLSDCEDWKPDGGTSKIVDCHTWYGATCLNNGGVEFKIWWMQNIPGRDNTVVYQGKPLRNWWEFYGNFDKALKSGKSLLSQ